MLPKGSAKILAIVTIGLTAVTQLFSVMWQTKDEHDAIADEVAKQLAEKLPENEEEEAE